MTFLRLAIRCPCGKRPPLKITEAERELAREQPPHLVKGDWLCRCGRLHDLTARSYAEAA